MTHHGEFGDDEDLYICDACAPNLYEALTAIRRANERPPTARPTLAFLDEDLLCEDV